MSLSNMQMPFDPHLLPVLDRRLSREREKRKQRKVQARRGGLIEFVRWFWGVLEPNTPLVEGWPLEAICLHLEAVTFGDIQLLLMNVPPGFMKSLLTDVFWPAWEAGPMNLPHLRYVAFAYAAGLTERDNGKFRDLLMSPEYLEMWGQCFTLRKIGETKVTNDHTGSKLATSVGGIGTGERGDRVIVDDPHNVKEGESELIRNETVRWFRESLSNRLNDMEKSAIVVIMQRVHEADVSGTILNGEMGYDHLMIPMEYEEGRHCSTSIGWEDPRTEDGELAWPARFPAHVVASLKNQLGPYAYAAQYQQAPAPRGGGIFKQEWWQLWDPPDGKWPRFEYLVASLDSAFTTKEENDPSGFTVWGLFHDETGQPRVMLVKAWRKHLEMHGETVERGQNETTAAYLKRARPLWGLVEWVAESCRFRSGNGEIIGTVDRLLIEAKASGITAAQEMQRLYGNDGWVTQLEPVKGDKVARAHAVVPSFSQGLVFAPDREWADLVIDEMKMFPKGRYKDLTDSATQALKHLRVMGMIRRPDERAEDDERASRHRSKSAPLYPG